MALTCLLLVVLLLLQCDRAFEPMDKQASFLAHYIKDDWAVYDEVRPATTTTHTTHNHPLTHTTTDADHQPLCLSSQAYEPPTSHSGPL